MFFGWADRFFPSAVMRIGSLCAALRPRLTPVTCADLGGGLAGLRGGLGRVWGRVFLAGWRGGVAWSGQFCVLAGPGRCRRGGCGAMFLASG
jgi:hypothetical protein